MEASEEYIRETVEKYSRTLLHTAYSILHSTADAEDAVQEAFIRLITKKPDFNDDGHEKAWLIRVTRNIACNMLKSAQRIAGPLDDELVPSAEDGHDELRDIVMSMPEKYSTVVHLYYYEGYSINEIAEILELPAATVGTRLARARKFLRNTLEGEEI